MKDLNRKLAEWAGFKIEYLRVGSDKVPTKHGSGAVTGFWRRPDNSLVKPNQLNFTESLDACDKWLMPKLKYYHMDNQNKPEHWAMVSIDGIHHRDSYGETPALALCLAIEKLIDKEKPNEEDGTSRTNNLPNEKE